MAGQSQAPKSTAFDPTLPTSGLKGLLTRRVRLYAATSDVGWEVLRAAHGTDVDDLIAECSANPVDARRILDVLERGLKDPQFSRSQVVDLLVTELTTTPALAIPSYRTPPVSGAVLAAAASAQARLRCLTMMFGRAHVLDDDQSSVAKLANRALNAVGIKTALGGNLDSFLADQPRLALIWESIRRAASVGARADHRLLLNQGEPRKIVYPQVYLLSGAVITGLAQGSGFVSPTEAREDDGRTETIARAALQAWAYRTVDSAISLLDPPIVLSREPPEAREYTKELTRAADSIDDWVTSLPILDQSRHRIPLTNALTRGLEASVRRRLVQSTLDVAVQAIPRTEVLRLGRAMLHRLANLSESINFEWAAASPDAAAKLVRRWASSTSEHAELQEHLERSIGELVSALTRGLAEVAAPTSVAWWETPSNEFWNRWIDDVVEASQSWPETWRVFEWARLPSATPDELGDHLKTVYAPQSYDVVFAVDGFNPQGRAWTAGDITWFAEGTLTLGEQWPGFDEAADGTKNQAYAWITTKAPSAYSAQRKARDVLEASLSSLVFAHSVNTTTTGLKPRVQPVALRADVSTGESTLESVYIREERSSNIRAVDDGLINFTNVYSGMIARAGRTSGVQPDIEVRLLRAFAWHRQGRWDARPATRFLAYFVALEHLFVGGTKGVKSAMPELARGLMVTWLKLPRRDAESIIPLAKRGTELRDKMLTDSVASSMLDSDARFHGWRQHPREFMSPEALDAAADTLSAGSSFPAELRAHSRNVRAFAHEWAKGVSLRDFERDRWQIVLTTLANRRHEIVHEAVVTGPDMDLYARRLEQALQSILDRLVNAALDSPRVRSVQDAIEWHKEPWA